MFGATYSPRGYASDYESGHASPNAGAISRSTLFSPPPKNLSSRPKRAGVNYGTRIPTTTVTSTAALATSTNSRRALGVLSPSPRSLSPMKSAFSPVASPAVCAFPFLKLSHVYFAFFFSLSRDMTVFTFFGNAISLLFLDYAFSSSTAIHTPFSSQESEA